MRKYQGQQDLVWGGSPDCPHTLAGTNIAGESYADKRRWQHEGVSRQETPDAWVKHEAPRQRGSGPENASAKQLSNAGTIAAMGPQPIVSATCSRCGAWRGPLGLEPTPEMYVEHLVQCFREIRRVLRKDGVCFLNLGDTYATQGGSRAYGSSDGKTGRGPAVSGVRSPAPGLKPKDLALVPFRVALALQADGWWVRSVIVWDKTNAMPESAEDRPTEAHEYILMLVKSGSPQFWTHRDKPATRTKPAPDYRWIHDETKEELAECPEGWTRQLRQDKQTPWARVNLWRGHDYYWDQEAVREKGVYSPGEQRYGGDHHKSLKAGSRTTAGLHDKTWTSTGSRNLRSVWRFPTEPYPGAHFATFPEELPTRCIKATSRPGDIILDPFAGTGVAGRAAVKLGRSAVMLDLAYHQDVKDRTRRVQMEMEV